MTTLRRDQVRLVHDLKANPPWQWHARQPWVDPFSRAEETYLGGDLTEGEARMYGRNPDAGEVVWGAVTIGSAAALVLA